MENSVYSVTEINRYISNMFDNDFLMQQVSVKGEVSNCKYHSSGHIYFSIKDNNSLLNCIMFAGKRTTGLKFRMQEGDKVVIKGNIGVYENQGKYQLYASSIEKQGKGELYQKFLQLKEELSDMGMFADIYKKPIPKYAMNIGVVTANTGAAIQDIINITKRRNPYVQLILYPAQVQGIGAAETIVKGINVLDAMPEVDIIIVGRGGGSLEDLWAFNERIVAEAIFNCETPVISAVGHEVDYTIADFVSDLRAPTPSAAAELAVFEYKKYEEDVLKLQRDLKDSIQRKIRLDREYLYSYKRQLDSLSPIRIIQSKRQRLSDMQINLDSIMKAKLTDRKKDLDSLENMLSKSMQDNAVKTRQELGILAEKLNGLSPLTKLKGGYVYASKEDKAIKSVNNISKGDNIELYLIDGKAMANVSEVIKEDKYE
ncbi:MAG: exodeoxyribonuclease VII large subunit [Lachnospiraceae bacterium]|nr:exodeoxyribonuclease VII large subunit [Lachnospiraceae bacterium]